MFGHAFDFAFELTSQKQDASDVNPPTLRVEAALDRFHHRGDIARLEDFLISMHPHGPEDSATSFRAIL